MNKGELFPFFAVSDGINLSVGFNSNVSSVVRFKSNSVSVVFDGELFPFLAMANSVDIALRSRIYTQISSVVSFEGNFSIRKVFLGEGFPFLNVGDGVDLVVWFNTEMSSVIGLNCDLGIVFEGFPFFAVSNGVDFSVWFNSDVSSMVALDGHSSMVMFNGEGFPFFAVSNRIDIVLGSWIYTQISSVVSSNGKSSIGLRNKSEVFPLFEVANNVEFVVWRRIDSDVGVVVSLERESSGHIYDIK